MVQPYIASGVVGEGAPAGPRLPLLLLLAAAVLWIPLEAYAAGAPCWLAGVVLLSRAQSQARLLLGLLYGCVACLAAAPIHTDLSNAHFLSLGLAFGAVVLVPAWILRRFAPDVQDWRFWPRRLAALDVIYTVISIPLAWGILRFYFAVNPSMPQQWPLPPVFTLEAEWRLIAGINAVGIWDELFFVNTVYAILRVLYPFWLANLAQAVIYTAVLYDMAFVGIGPLVIYGFALTQGAMYERSRCLFYVLIVHLIVDAFLVAAILQGHYPDRVTGWWL